MLKFADKSGSQQKRNTKTLISSRAQELQCKRGFLDRVDQLPHRSKRVPLHLFAYVLCVHDHWRPQWYSPLDEAYTIELPGKGKNDRSYVSTYQLILNCLYFRSVYWLTEPFRWSSMSPAHHTILLARPRRNQWYNRCPIYCTAETVSWA